MGNFTSLLESTKPLLFDGAMGTQLHNNGVRIRDCFDALNILDPAAVSQIHHSYLNARADLIGTNTFSANRYKLAAHGLDQQVGEINVAGVTIAKRSIDSSFREVALMGAVGPLGVRLAPYGRVPPEQARAAFEEQISALVSAGVDGIILETFSDLNEIRTAVQALKAVNPSTPLIASMTFTRDDRTLLGDEPEYAARALTELEVDVIGLNCASGPAQLLRILQAMRAVEPAQIYAVMPNAGWPERLEDRIMYRATPEYFGEYARAFIAAGARIVGGCCGTTPQHISTMYDQINSPTHAFPLEMPAEKISPSQNGHAHSVRPTQLAQKLTAKEFVISVEVDPPRGHTPHKLLAGVSLLAEAGADVINVADTPLARMRMSAWAVCHLIQQQVGLETILHFPTRGRNLLRLQGDLLAAYALGVRNLFVVLGDPTAVGDYPEAMNEFDLAPSGLVRLIKQRFNHGVDHAGQSIGQPTSFLVGTAANPQAADMARELRVLQHKIANGADFILTQPVFDIAGLQNFIDAYESEYDVLDVPLIVGVLPLNSERHTAFLHNEVPGIEIPDSIRTRVFAAKDGIATGLAIAHELIQQLREVGNVRGIYLMPPFGRFDLAAELIERTKEGISN